MLQAPASMGLASVFGYENGFVTTVDSKGHIKGAVGLTNVSQPQQLKSQMPSQAYTNNDMAPSQVSLLFKGLILPPISLCWCLLWYCFLLSGFYMASMPTSRGSTIGVHTPATL